MWCAGLCGLFILGGCLVGWAVWVCGLHHHYLCWAAWPLGALCGTSPIPCRAQPCLSPPQAQAADIVRILCIGRNEYIAIMVQVR